MIEAPAFALNKLSARGERQSVETLINEEALLLAKYLRGENETWIPRVPSFPFPSVVECVVATQE